MNQIVDFMKEKFKLIPYDKIAKYENIRAKGQNKHCEICYANIQGIRALIKTFGKTYLKT